MQLFEYQKKVVAEVPNKWGIWADVGTGKSAMCISLVEKIPIPLKVLIITTKSLKKNWNNEVKMWGNPSFHTYYIVSKEELRCDHQKYPKCDVLIFDEAHNAAYYSNKIHKATAWYIKTHKPQYVWFATATPILSNVMSVWGLSVLLGSPLGSFKQFQFKYFRKVKMGFRDIWVQKRGIEADIALDLKKIGTVLSKDDCLDLPEFVHEFEYFDMTAEQKRGIKDLDKDPTTTTPIVYHTKCLQIANGTLKAEPENKEFKCEKLVRVVELAGLYPRCVIVAKHTAELLMIQKKISGSRIYHGATSIEERDEIIKEANEGKCVMLLQASMGIGFNLVGVSLMIFYSHDYDYVKYSQCLGRIHRIGQKNKCTYIHLITDKTIDAEVFKALEKKENFDIELYSRQQNENN